MLVWEGYGLLAFGPPLAIAIVMEVLVDVIGGSGTYTHASALFAGIALILSGPPTWALARWLDGRTPTRHLMDPVSGESVVLRTRHRFFFIETRIWAKLWPICGVIFLVAGAFNRFQA